MTTTHQERSAAEAIYAGLGLTVIAMLSRTSTMPPPTCWPTSDGGTPQICAVTPWQSCDDRLRIGLWVRQQRSGGATFGLTDGTAG